MCIYFPFLHICFVKQVTTINLSAYCATLQKLLIAINNNKKKTVYLNSKIVLMKDKCVKFASTRELLKKLNK